MSHRNSGLSILKAVRAALIAVALTAEICVAGTVSTEVGEIPPSRERLYYSFAPIVSNTVPAVVNIYSRKLVRTRSATRYLDGSAFWELFRDSLLFGYGRDRIENALGSGVIVRPDGIIVTNHHVIEDAQGILVVLADGRIFPAEVLTSDRRSDIAVLRIYTGGERLPAVELGDSDGLTVGDLVLAIGNPFGLGQTVTSGIVSALARTSAGTTDFRFFIQTDAAINPGNSGGALVAMDGKLVGINTSIYSSSGISLGLGFAVPSNMVRTIVEAAVLNRPLIRPWIGVSGQRVPPQYAASLGLTNAKGVLVTSTYAHSPANRAGIAAGDVILSVDGFPIDDIQALRYRVATRMVGERLKLTLMRARAKIDIALDLEPPPDKPARNEMWAPNLSPFRGARMTSLSPALAEEIGLDSALSGVVVLAVTPGSAAQRLGIDAGDIIRAYNGHEVRTTDELFLFQLVPLRPWSIFITRRDRNVLIGHK